MRRVTQSFGKRERKQNYCKDQWNESQQNQIEPFVPQMHEDRRNNQNLCKRRTNEKKRLEPFIDWGVTQSQRCGCKDQKPCPGLKIEPITYCVLFVFSHGMKAYSIRYGLPSPSRLVVCVW